MPGYLLETAQLSRDSEGNLRSLTYDDIYHSAEGGLAEKTYVFLEQNKLLNRWQQIDNSRRSHFTIMETGFGLGLNFLLTARLWLDSAPKTAVLFYRAVEKHPLSLATLRESLSGLPLDEKLVLELLAQYPQPLQGIHRLWLQSNICLDLIFEDVLDAFDKLQPPVDAWYLDGFSPARNEAMWAETLWPMIAAASRPGTTLATYTAAGSVRRGLSRVGFDVSRRHGFGNKREMLVARYNGPGRPAHQMGRKQTAHVAIIGGGLAGTTCAHQLLRRNTQVTLFEACPDLARGASGIYQLAYYPQLASAFDPYCSFSLQAFMYLHNYLAVLRKDTTPIGHDSGLIRLMEKNKIQQITAPYRLCPGIVREVSAEQASELAGIPLAQGGIYFPMAGWLDPDSLIQAQCTPFTDSGQLVIRHNTTITSMEKEGSLWNLQDQLNRNVGKFSAVVIASGSQAADIPQLSNLPLEPVRGQTAVLGCDHEQGKPNVVLAGRVGLFPGNNYRQGVSATYEHGSSDQAIRQEDLTWLLAQTRDLFPGAAAEAEESRVGIRCVARDRHPIAGPVPNWQKLKDHYAPLARNARAKIAAFEVSGDNLYVCTAFGSHGVTHIPLCADYLASLICGDPDPLTSLSRQVMDPSRFMIRDIKKQLT